jgi:hypothetical protein
LSPKEREPTPGTSEDYHPDPPRTQAGLMRVTEPAQEFYFTRRIGSTGNPDAFP